MKLRTATVLLVVATSLLSACSSSSSSDNRVKNEALGAIAPTITKIEPGDGSLTVFVSLPGGIAPNTWFYQLETNTPGAANSLSNGTETVRNAPPSFTITGLTNGATYTVRVAHWNGETSSYASATAVPGLVAPTTATVTPTTVTPTTSTAPATPCRSGGDCAIGDTGPGGGIVFYDAGSVQPWGRYLEVAQENLPARTFGCAGTAPVVAIATIGGGFANSDELALSSCGSNSAAASAYNFTLGGVNGWYLPSKDELTELCKFANNQPTGDTTVACTKGDGLRASFSPTFYWSSTQDGNDFAWYQNFVTGQQLRYGKPATAAVRPIRAFTNKDGITVPTTLVPKPCKRGGECKVGDTGPGGGTVFYVASTVQKWGQYMEVAPTIFMPSGGSWECTPTGVKTGREVGAGAGNTRLLVDRGCSAARLTNDYVSPTGVDDWFLPSIDEAVFAARAGLLNESSGTWSSSLDSCLGTYCFYYSTRANGFVPDSAGPGAGGSANATGVRAVRMFKKVG